MLMKFKDEEAEERARLYKEQNKAIKMGITLPLRLKEKLDDIAEKECGYSRSKAVALLLEKYWEDMVE